MMDDHRDPLYHVEQRVIFRDSHKAYDGTIDGVLPYDARRREQRYRVQTALGLISVPEGSLRPDTRPVPEVAP